MISATKAQAERLAMALRFRTVTIRGDNPSEDPGMAEFRGLNVALRKCFPGVAATLRWEETPHGALLLHWAPMDPSEAAPPVLLCAHSDVVPAGDESDWSHPPFSGDVADGFIWGRGSLDDKASLVGILEAMESLVVAGLVPRRGVYVAVGCDEETTGLRGAATLAGMLAERGVRLAAVVDEGSVIVRGLLSSLDRPVAPVGVAEKGYADLEIRVDGPGGHSSMPGRHTSGGVLSRILADLEAHPPPLRLIPVVRRFFRDLGRAMQGPQGLLMRHLGLTWPLLRRTLAANPTIAALLRTTRALTVLRSGEAENVLPAQARAVLNLRILPGQTVREALLAVLRCARRHATPGFAVTVAPSGRTRAWDPVGESRAEGEIWGHIARALSEAVPDAVVAPFLTPGLTDSRNYAGISDAIYRVLPILVDRMDLGLIHGVDERISLENYGRLIRFYRRLIEDLAGRRDSGGRAPLRQAAR